MSHGSDAAFRIRGLPERLKDSFEAAKLLVKLEDRLGPIENISLSKLTSEAAYWGLNRNKTTIASFTKLPPLLDDPETLEWTVSGRKSGIPVDDIVIDRHFLGFTLLNEIDDRKHVIDCIAISGLASHAFGSWKQRGSSHMWLRDTLPEDNPMCRSIIYGYDSELLKGHSTQTIDDIAQSFMLDLKNMGAFCLASRPVCFLAHSLGGIVLKRAIVSLAWMARTGVRERRIMEQIKAILFFGVPSKGMTITHLLPMVEGKPSEQLIQSLRPDSTYLKTLEDQFEGILQLHQIRLVCSFETKTTPTPELSATGEWETTGQRMLLVRPESATLRICANGDRIPINEDHSNMVKYGPRDHNYQKIVAYIREVIQSLRKPPFLLDTNQNIRQKPLVEQLSPQAASRRVEKSSTNYNSIGSKSFFKAATGEVQHLALSAPTHLTHGERHDDVLWDDDFLRQMMTTLSIREFNSRFDNVEDAYESTFEWIFGDASLGFVDWLSSGAGTYWISGKPGSGKSTLMKYIYQRKHTLESYLDTKIRAAFFFHNRGTYIQKSFEGLYRSILHQILEQEPNLRTVLAPIYQRRAPEQRNIWPLSDLKECLQAILRQEIVANLKIFLFLDALDEYDGPPEVIANFVKSTQSRSSSSATTIQVLFSSRPWNVFTAYFETSPGVRIDKYTQGDIQKYIQHELERWTELGEAIQLAESTAEDESLDHVGMIMRKAEGVFVWVKLTLMELSRSAKQIVHRGEPPELLKEVIMSLPQGLPEFYAEIIRRLPNNSNNRLETYTMLEIVLCAEEELELYSFWAAFACAQCFTLSDCQRAIKHRILSAALAKNFQKRIQERCGGLLEVVSSNSSTNGPLVRFMHQTVKDFVSSGETFSLIMGSTMEKPLENGFHFLTKSHLTLALTQESRPTGDLFLELNYANKAEKSSGTSHRSFFDSIADESMINYFWPRRLFGERYSSPNLQTLLYPINSVLSFAVVADLWLYLEQRLLQHPLVNQNPMISLLHCAVFTTANDITRKDLGYRGKFQFGIENCQTASVLMKHGADKQALFHGATPFEVLFCQEYEGFNNGGPGFSVSNKEMILVFLKHGQDPDSKIPSQPRSSTHTPYFCRPLHIINGPLAETFLDYGADVNALNEKGHTPLDIAYGVGWNVYEIGSRYPSAKAYSHAMYLISRGGRATKAIDEILQYNKSCLEIFLEILSRDFSIDARLRNPPRLPKDLS